MFYVEILFTDGTELEFELSARPTVSDRMLVLDVTPEETNYFPIHHIAAFGVSTGKTAEEARAKDA